YDVDLLAAQLADDRLHARALHADAGADRVDVALAAEHRDLGTLAGGADGGLDHHRAVVDLRHFHLEELDQQARIGAREHDLRSLGLLVDVGDDGADALALAVALVARLLGARHGGLGAAEVDDDVAALEALDGAVHDLAHAVDVLVVDLLALGLADALVEHLLGVLGRDAAETLGRERQQDLVADLGAGLALLGFLDG